MTGFENSYLIGSVLSLFHEYDIFADPMPFVTIADHLQLLSSKSRFECAASAKPAAQLVRRRSVLRLKHFQGVGIRCLPVANADRRVALSHFQLISVSTRNRFIWFR